MANLIQRHVANMNKPEQMWFAINLLQICYTGKSVFSSSVDYYSGYFEVQDLSHTATVISDNGPPFNSEDFKSFSKEWDFHHITSSPYHAQSNGRVENAVKTCK